MRSSTLTAGLLVAAALSYTSLTLAQAPDPLLAVVVDPVPPADEHDGGFAGNPIDFFDTYSWRIFIALNWPAAAGQRGVADTTKTIADTSALRVWESWKSVEETYLPKGAKPADWTGPDLSRAVCKNLGDMPASITKILADFNQGDLSGNAVGPLIAQNRTYVRYEIRLNRLEYDAIRDRELYLRDKLPADATAQMAPLPNGSIDVKAAWREVKTGENADRYYVREALAIDPTTGRCDVRRYALIGFHIAQRTPTRPQWIWSTFEHVDNVAVALGAPAGTKSSLNDPAKPQVLDPVPAAITASNPPKANPDPVQVIFERSENKPPASTEAINAKWQSDPRISATVWRNYKLIMSQWPAQPTAGPLGSPFPARRVANMTMETFLQASSCIGCHFKTTHGTDFAWFMSMRAFPVKESVISNAKTTSDQAKTP